MSLPVLVAVSTWERLGWPTRIRVTVQAEADG